MSQFVETEDGVLALALLLLCCLVVWMCPC